MTLKALGARIERMERQLACETRAPSEDTVLLHRMKAARERLAESRRQEAERKSQEEAAA